MRNLVWGNGDSSGKRQSPRNVTGVEDELHGKIVLFYRDGNSIAVTANRFGISARAALAVLKLHGEQRRPRVGGSASYIERGDVPAPTAITLPHLKFLDPASLLPFERGHADA
jgi:hypothetical protein